MTAEYAKALAGLWDRARELAKGLEQDDWARPVAWCPGWDVGDTVSHLSGLQSLFNGDPQPEPPAGWEPPQTQNLFDAAMAPLVAARREWTPAQRLEELERAADAHVRHLELVEDWDAHADGPVGPTTQGGLARVRAFDLWVHLQDLREALGMPVELDDDSQGAAEASRHTLGLIPYLFVKKAGALDGAAMRVTLGAPLDTDRVVRVDGTRAAWDEAADAGDNLLAGSPAALTLLTSGRGDADRWREAGALHVSGPRAEEFVALARMF